MAGSYVARLWRECGATVARLWRDCGAIVARGGFGPRASQILLFGPKGTEIGPRHALAIYLPCYVLPEVPGGRAASHDRFPMGVGRFVRHWARSAPSFEPGSFQKVLEPSSAGTSTNRPPDVYSGVPHSRVPSRAHPSSGRWIDRRYASVYGWGSVCGSIGGMRPFTGGGPFLDR